MKTRNQKIITTSLAGIGANLLLAGLKFAIGTVTRSVSVCADALNNTTDALSFIITIVGTRLSEKRPDKKHPFGYGRLEYVASLLIGIMITYAGVASLLASARRILHPQPGDYSLRAMVLLAAAVAVKILIGLYTIKQGKKLDAGALKAAGKDSVNDAGASALTLAAGLLCVYTGVSVEAYVGVLISAFILKTGFETLRETVSSLLGERIDFQLAAAIKQSILSFPEVNDVFDITVHNYGSRKLIASAHIEVPDALRASWIDNLQRAITEKVFADTGVEMMGITIYAVNAADQEALQMRETIRNITTAYSTVKGMHGFYFDKVDREISFELETGFETADPSALWEELTNRIMQEYPDCKVHFRVSHSFE